MQALTPVPASATTTFLFIQYNSSNKQKQQTKPKVFYNHRYNIMWLCLINLVLEHFTSVIIILSLGGKRAIFTAQHYANAVYAVIICPSVCLSVTIQSSMKMVKPNEWMNENARILSAFENRLRAGFV